MYLLASKAGILTGRQIARALKIRFHINADKIKQGSEVLIRYGNAQQSNRIGKDTSTNSRDSILKMSAKHRLWEYLQDSEILSPRYYRLHEIPDDLEFPCLVRSRMHRAGKDIQVCDAPYEIPRNAEYVVPYYPTIREYRVHVAFGNIVKIMRKYPINDNAHDKIRTSAFGWQYKRSSLDDVMCSKSMVETAMKTAEVLGSDFCGIDMAWSSKEHGLNKWIVWEVNSAPSLNGPSLKLYVDLFKSQFAERLREYGIHKSKQNNARNKSLNRGNKKRRQSKRPISRPSGMRQNYTRKNSGKKKRTSSKYSNSRKRRY
ncbi:hypothetical protein LCGC14_1868310 [marine sediment metagenome]|uniref:ATP-grasp domain-containing protein n=1 Tax=marine sediment metagenome TaxID=412755 RepID=A0A0F9IJT2_9ZZZZ